MPYLIAPAWRGTSPVYGLRSTPEIRAAVATKVRSRLQARGFRGLGAAIVSGDPSSCNWVDDFGSCIVPTAGDVITTPGGLRLTVGAGGGGTPSGSPSTATAWLNKNAGNLAIGAGVLVGLSLLFKMSR